MKYFIILGMMLLQTKAHAITSREKSCITQTVYYESRGQPTSGQKSVMHTILNRMKHKNFPNNACDVVYQKNQFTWTTQNKGIREKKVFYKIQKNVDKWLVEKSRQPTDKAHFFTRTEIQRKWMKKHKFLGIIGDHKFYKMKG